MPNALFPNMCGVMFNQLQYWSSLIGVLYLAIAPAVKAEVISGNHFFEAATAQVKPQIDEGQANVLSQQAETTIQITNIQIYETEAGLVISLETLDNRIPQSFINRFGETVIIDLTNTQLTLPVGDSLVKVSPTTEIALIQVDPLDSNSVRITITGQEQAPNTNIVQTNGNLRVDVSTTDTVTDQSEDTEAILEPSLPADEGLRIVVTGEAAESPYLAPETTAGTRTDTSIFEIPQTIQVLPERLLEDQQIIRLEEAILNVPNAVGGNQAGGADDNIVIRGFTNTQVLRDGFRDSSTVGVQQGLEELANVERIEVLSGPASVLFGTVEPGGVVNLVTKRPLSEFFLETGVQVGSYGLVRPTLDVTGPLTADGNLLYRLNAAYEYGDGFRDFDTDVERFFIAPVLEWQISDRTTLALELEYIDDKGPFDRGIPAIGDEVADVPLDTILGEPDDFFEIEALDVGYRFEHEFSDSWRLRNRFRYTNADYLTRRAELEEAVGGINEETGDIFRIFESNDSDTERFNFQTELVGEFATGSIEHTLLLGVDVFFSDLIQRGSIDFAPPVNLFEPRIGEVDPPELPLAIPTGPAETDLSQVGVILQDQIKVSPNLIFLLGGRLDFITQRSATGATFIPGLPPIPALSEENNFTNFSPRVGVVYQPVEPLFFYASYSQSFTPNTVTQTTVEGGLLDPLEAEQFEIGVKAELLEGRLAATLALFDLNLENVAVDDPDNFGFVIPIGEQRSSGLELLLQGEILPGWNVVASYGFLDAELIDEALPEGARPRNSSENTASLFTTYEIQSGALAGLGFGLGAFFVGERPGDFENTFMLDSYWRTDASVFYRGDRWRAGLNFQNIFDVDYFASGFTRAGARPGDPFTVVGSLSVTF